MVGQPNQEPLSADEQAMNIAEGILNGGEQPLPVKEAEPDEEVEQEVEAEAEDSSDGETEAEAETQAEESEAQEETQPRRLKLKYKGEEREYDESEVIELAQKGFDYTRKTQDLSRERDSIQEKINAELEPRLKELDDKLGMAEAVLYNTIAPEMNNTNWAELAEQDPAEWARRKAKVEGVQMQLQRVQQERQQLQQRAAQQQQKNIQKAVRESREILQNDIPDWSDDLYGKILNTAVSDYGFKPEEVNQVWDHRAIKLLHDAMQYRALKAKPPEGKKVAPKAPKVLKPGAGEKTDQKVDKRKQDWARFRKSGKREDGIAVLERMLEAEGITD